MPKVFEEGGYKFFFFSNEGIPTEPCHVHVRKGAATAKFWLVPSVSLSDSWGLSSKDLKTIEKIAEKRKDEITEKWNEYFS